MDLNTARSRSRLLRGPPNKISGATGPQWSSESGGQEENERNRKIRAPEVAEVADGPSNRLRSSTLEQFLCKVLRSSSARAQDGDLIQQIPWRRNVHRFKWNHMVYSKWFEAYQHCLQFVSGEIMLYELYSAPQKILVDHLCQLVAVAHKESGAPKIATPAPKYSIQKIIIGGIKRIPDCALAPGDSGKFEEPNVIFEVGVAEPDIALADKAEMWLQSDFVDLVVLCKLYHPIPMSSYKGPLFTASVWVRYDTSNPFHAQLEFPPPIRAVPANGTPIRIQRETWTAEDIFPPKPSETAPKAPKIERPVMTLNLPRYAMYGNSKRYQTALAYAEGDILKVKRCWQGNVTIPISAEVIDEVLSSVEDPVNNVINKYK